jgi:hypothetical protein
MTLEGIIRSSAGKSETHTVDGPDYPTAKTKLVQLLSEGSALLWIREV